MLLLSCGASPASNTAVPVLQSEIKVLPIGFIASPCPLSSDGDRKTDFLLKFFTHLKDRTGFSRQTRETTMKRVLATLLLTLTLFPAVALAQAVIRIGPPPPIVERPGPSPGARYVWVPGYQRWDGNRYVWVRGHYVVPPRRDAVWVPAHYVRRSGGYVFVAGHWR